jgi:hypothetical protein
MIQIIGLSLAFLVSLAISSDRAGAENIKLPGFFGTFKGSGISENKDSYYFGVTVRDLDVKIEPSGNGFAIEWTTVIRAGGDPANPKVRQKTQRMTFAPSAQTGVYRAAGAGDPLSGQPYSWSYIRNNSLIVHIMTIDAKGAYEMQSYTRTLEPTGMSYVFERIRNDEPVRTVKGKLIKFAQ